MNGLFRKNCLTPGFWVRALGLLYVCLLLSACDMKPPLPVKVASLTPVAGPSFRFDWQGVPRARYYRLLENPDGLSGYAPVAEINAFHGYFDPEEKIVELSHRHDVTLPLRLNARYVLQSCNAAGCSDSAPLAVSGNLAAAIGYLKADHTNPLGAGFSTVALNDAGDLLAVGASGDNGAAVPIQTTKPDPQDNSLLRSGAVYLFARVAGRWQQQAYIKAEDAYEGDRFGGAGLSFNAAGDVLAVGAVAGSGYYDTRPDFGGAVYVFAHQNGRWRQQARLEAPISDKSDGFGEALSLNDAGDVLAVGASGEDSQSRNDGELDPDDNQAEAAGAVYVFTRVGGQWSQQPAYLKASNTGRDDGFGGSVSLNGAGTVLAVGAHGEASGASSADPDPDQEDNTLSGAGAVYLFTRSGNDWTQQDYLKASNPTKWAIFGESVSLNRAGTILAVGASAAVVPTGLGSEPIRAGGVYVFERHNNQWQQPALIAASNLDTDDLFGWDLKLNGEGDLLAVSAVRDASAFKGLSWGTKAPLDNAAPRSGAVYFFKRAAINNWFHLAYLKASNTDELDGFGGVLSLARQSNTLAVGANGEQSRATGFDGDQTDNGQHSAGAVYLY